MTDYERKSFLALVKSRIRVSPWAVLTPPERRPKPTTERSPLKVFVVVEDGRRFVQIAESRDEAQRIFNLQPVML